MNDGFSNDVLQEIYVLYELSLSIGNSLDLTENSRQFLNTLMTKKNLNAASVWIHNNALLKGQMETGYAFIYGAPAYRFSNKQLPEEVKEVELLKDKEFIVITDKDPDFKELIREENIESGAFALYRLGDFGFLKIYSKSSAEKEISEFKKLNTIMQKFSVSLNGCIAHLRATDNETKITKLIDSALDAVVLINADGFVTHWNKQATEIFGWTSEEAIGSDMSTLFIPHRHRPAHNAGMKNYHATGEGPVLNNRIEITAINKKGHEFDVELTVVPIKLHGTTVFSGFIRDITEEKKSKQALIEAREKAEASVKAKEEFLANMSHEIRTPLNAIKGMGELLSFSDMNEKDASYVNAIERSTKNLLVIVNDILDFSKIEAGKVNIEKIGFDLKHMVEVLYHSEKTKAFKKDLDFKYEYDDRIDNILISDPVRLNQILLNLINNALKFTNSGHILLKTELLYKTPALNAIRFIIKDTGIGIEPEKVESIFDEFTQADASITRRFGGTGLGLTISRKLVELLDGHITVESIKNVGTTFSVVMNLNIGTAADLPNLEIEKKAVEDLKGKNILLVEDHDLNQMLATAILEELGMKVILAENGQEAVDKVQSESCDLILMDMQMPVMDGLEATTIIRNELKNRIPIIALTANATMEHKNKCLEAGMDDYLAKPFESAILVNKIHGLLFKSRETEIKVLSPSNEKEVLPKDHIPTEKSELLCPVLHPKKEKVEETPPMIEVQYDLSFLERETRGNKAMMKKMLSMFIDRTPAMLAEMETALEQKNWEKTRSIAHKMKPSLQMLGASDLKDLAKSIELTAKEEIETDKIPDLFESLKINSQLLIHKLTQLDYE